MTIVVSKALNSVTLEFKPDGSIARLVLGVHIETQDDQTNESYGSRDKYLDAFPLLTDVQRTNLNTLAARLRQLATA